MGLLSRLLGLRPAAGPPAPAEDGVAQAGAAPDGDPHWVGLPAMPLARSAVPLTVQTAAFEASLPSRARPFVLGAMGHDLTTDAPSGVIHDLATPPPAAAAFAPAVDLPLRRTEPATPTVSRWSMRSFGGGRRPGSLATPGPAPGPTAVSSDTTGPRPTGVSTMPGGPGESPASTEPAESAVPGNPAGDMPAPLGIQMLAEADDPGAPAAGVPPGSDTGPREVPVQADAPSFRRLLQPAAGTANPPASTAPSAAELGLPRVVLPVVARRVEAAPLAKGGLPGVAAVAAPGDVPAPAPPSPTPLPLRELIGESPAVAGPTSTSSSPAVSEPPPDPSGAPAGGATRAPTPTPSASPRPLQRLRLGEALSEPPVRSAAEAPRQPDLPVVSRETVGLVQLPAEPGSVDSGPTGEPDRAAMEGSPRPLVGPEPSGGIPPQALPPLRLIEPPAPGLPAARQSVPVAERSATGLPPSSPPFPDAERPRSVQPLSSQSPPGLPAASQSMPVAERSATGLPPLSPPWPDAERPTSGQPLPVTERSASGHSPLSPPLPVVERSTAGIPFSSGPPPVTPTAGDSDFGASPAGRMGIPSGGDVPSGLRPLLGDSPSTAEIPAESPADAGSGGGEPGPVVTREALEPRTLPLLGEPPALQLLEAAPPSASSETRKAGSDPAVSPLSSEVGAGGHGSHPAEAGHSVVPLSRYPTTALASAPPPSGIAAGPGMTSRDPAAGLSPIASTPGVAGPWPNGEGDPLAAQPGAAPSLASPVQRSFAETRGPVALRSLPVVAPAAPGAIFPGQRAPGDGSLSPASRASDLPVATPPPTGAGALEGVAAKSGPGGVIPSAGSDVPPVVARTPRGPAASAPLTVAGRPFTPMPVAPAGSATAGPPYLPAPEEAVVQREPASWPASSVVQRDDAPVPAAPAPATLSPTTPASPAPASQGGGGEGDLDDLSRRLYDRIRDRMKAELYLDRERAGLLTDLNT